MITDYKNAEEFRTVLESAYREAEVRLDTQSAPSSTSSTPNRGMNWYIDQTLLKPEATTQQVLALCESAKTHAFRAVCVNTRFVSLCRKALSGTEVRIAAVVGFPLGASLTSVKAFEAKIALEQGAKEIDMVLSVGALKEGDFFGVFQDIVAVVRSTAPWPVKVILETCLLGREEKIRAALIAKLAGAAFVKTSTGFSSGGATLDDVRLLRAVVGTDMGVKASGGVRDRKVALDMIDAGADRIGTSSGEAIMGSGPKAAEGSY